MYNLYRIHRFNPPKIPCIFNLCTYTTRVHFMFHCCVVLLWSRRGPRSVEKTHEIFNERHNFKLSNSIFKPTFDNFTIAHEFVRWTTKGYMYYSMRSVSFSFSLSDSVSFCYCLQTEKIIKWMFIHRKNCV